jgi:hypothetical protein
LNLGLRGKSDAERSLLPGARILLGVHGRTSGAANRGLSLAGYPRQDRKFRPAPKGVKIR